MSPAYFDTGFSVREPMWHGEGWVLDDYPTDWADARVKAGLTWEPAEAASYYAVPHDVARVQRLTTDNEFVVTPFVSLRKSVDTKLIVRNDTYAEIGAVTDSFSLVYHGGKNRASMENIIDCFAGTQKSLKFETAGAARGGKVVWALMYLDEPYTPANDDTQTYPYMALLNPHDGTGSCKLVFTQVRVVCWNTYNAASMEGDRTGHQIVFRHVGDVEGRIAQAKEAIIAMRSAAGEWSALSTELFGMPADEAALNHFIADFIPEPPADVVSDRVRANIDTARKVFKSIYLDSPTTTSHRGTALGLVDTAVEYLDHVRGFRSRDTYLGRTLLKPEPLKARATTLARQVCK